MRKMESELYRPPAAIRADLDSTRKIRFVRRHSLRAELRTSLEVSDQLAGECFDATQFELRLF